jgi:glucosamine-6-phosphate isomerase
MEVSIYRDYDMLSSAAADEILSVVKNKPEAVLCFASGDTPRLTYARMVQRAVNEKIDFTRCTFIGLDEWVGIPPDNEGSCHYFLKKLIFEPLQAAPEQIHLFDALSENLQLQCMRMDKVIAEKGRIDLMMVGIGMNGHIGFNEPGVPADLYSHVVELDEATQKVGQKYFRQHTLLQRGITLGLKHLLQSRKAILIANGVRKADVIRKALEEEISSHLPASIIRIHTNVMVMLDEEAASALEKAPEYRSRKI